MKLRFDQSTLDMLVGRAREDDPFCVFSQGPDDADMQIHEAITGMHDSVRRRFLERLERQRDDDIDELTARLLVHAGIDPVAMAVAVAFMGDEGVYVIRDDDGDHEICDVRSEKNHQNGYVELSDEVRWNFDGTVIMPPLPHTVLAALPGKKLHEAIAHPIMDAFPHTIASARIENIQGTDCTYITTPRRAHVRLRIDQLAAHRPIRLKEAA